MSFLIYLISGAGLAGRGNDTSGIVFFCLGAAILIAAGIGYSLHAKKEEKKRIEKLNKRQKKG